MDLREGAGQGEGLDLKDMRNFREGLNMRGRVGHQGRRGAGGAVGKHEG